MDGNRAVEDGLIGALMGYLATTHRETHLMSSDSDFIECQRIIKNEMGTRMNTICPPVTKMPEHHPNFMGTKPEVVSNQHSNWICAFTAFPTRCTTFRNSNIHGVGLRSPVQCIARTQEGDQVRGVSSGLVP